MPARPVLTAAALLLAGPALAQAPAPFTPPAAPVLGREAAATLGMLGLTAIPDGTMSDLSVSQGQGGSNGLLLGQFGAGFTLSPETPLYLEGFLGYARRDSSLTLSNGADRRPLPFAWDTASATVGVGWSFPLADRLQVRPIVNAMLGAVSGETVASPAQLASVPGLDRRVLPSGRASAVGLGGALVLAWHDPQPEGELEVELRYSHMRLETLPERMQGVSLRSDVATLGLWTRYRWPMGIEAFGRPMRWVVEATHSEFLEDKRDGLGFPRLSRLGGGVELDVGRLEVGLDRLSLQRVRLLGSVIAGEDVRGWSVGIGIGF